uniref:Uncharacterized protein n=1 Tax=Fundulus heteroclitus TaxID=8078 RepID=A0A3Q2T1Y8_FUNHE
RMEREQETNSNADRFHVKARQLHYPNSKITRFPVPEEKVPWNVSFSSYMPTYYSPEDGGDHVDGNPEGRTGIRGRGALSHLGPNLNLDLVVTRSNEFEIGFFRWRDSSTSVLEYLAVLNPNFKSLALPGVSEKCYKCLNRCACTVVRHRHFPSCPMQTVSEGYVDDCRNTDNAWVETTVLNIHLDRTSQVIADINNLVGCFYFRFCQVDRRSRLSSNQRVSLQKVAVLHNMKF